MNTKITILCMLFSVLLHAQTNCNELLSLFAENVKTKRFAEAAPQLIELRKNCPSTNYAIYAYGERVLDYELENAANKKEAAQKLMQLYTDRLELYPEKTKKGVFLPKIAALMITHEIGTISEQYSFLHEAFTSDKKHFTNPVHLYYYFELYYKMYQAKTSGISLEQLIEKFDAIQEKYELIKQQAPKNAKAIETLLANMNILIEKEATCETLIPMFRKKLETERSNIDWLKKAAGQLDAKGCKENPLFIELVEAIDAAAPNANSKLYLYQIHRRKGNSAKAQQYLEAYVTLETDVERKTTVLNSVGKEAEKTGQKSTARSYYLKAITANPNSGRAYLNLARLYGSSANECGTDSFTKRAVYWKAAEMAKKAASVDASVKSEAKSLEATYMQSAPSKPDIFNKGYTGGEKITLDCWIGGYVTVPKI